MRTKSCLIIDVKREYRKLKDIVSEELQVLAVGDEPRVSFNPLDTAARGGGRALGQGLHRRLHEGIRALGAVEAHPSGLPLGAAGGIRRGARPCGSWRARWASFKAGSTKEQASKRSLESRLHIINMGKESAGR